MADKYTDRINAMLAKAESSTFPAEREEFTRKAQELMQLHVIDQAMLDSAREGNDVVDVIRTGDLIYTGTLGEWHRRIGSVIAAHNTARCVVSERKEPIPGKKKLQHQFVLSATAHSTDLELIELLNNSMRLQVAAAMNEFDRARPHVKGGELYRDRRQFLISFAEGLADQLYTANEAATVQAAWERAGGVASVDYDEHKAVSVLRVALRSREKKVSDAFHEKYPHLRSSRSRGVEGGSGAASSAGFSAGRSANTSRPSGVGGRAIGSGR